MIAVRPYQPQDGAVLKPWFADEAAMVAWGGPPVHWPLDDAQLEQMQADPNRTMWTAVLGTEIAGHFQLIHDRRRRTMRLGRVAIAPGLRGRGLAGPMLRLAIERAFRVPEVRRMELQVYEHNAPARATYTRLGFVLEGMLREDVPVASGGQTQFWSTALMGLLRPEWERLV